jgi:palmitoyltransferase
MFIHSDQNYPNNMRYNGFDSPLNGLQILTWFLFPFFLVGHGAMPVVAMWSSEPSSLIPNAILSGLIFLGAAYGVFNGGMACATDPIDDHLMAHLAAGAKGRTQGAPDKSFCWVCQVHVAKPSKHCRFCCKCIKGFDHHCAWLNTCIGEANYGYFFRCVTGVLFFTAVELSAFVLVLVRWFVEGSDGEVQRTVASIYGSSSSSKYTFVCFLVLFTIVLLVTVSMITQLFLFHVMLYKNNMSTFDYVVADSRKQQAREKEEGERNYQRGEMKKRRIKNGETLYCEAVGGGCWVGGQKETAKIPKDSAVQDDGASAAGDASAAAAEIELSGMVVRDHDHEEQI